MAAIASGRTASRKFRFLSLRVLGLVLGLGLSLAGPPGPWTRAAMAGGGSYRKLDGEGDVARFYATRGEAFVGRSLHIHVPRTVFRKEVPVEKRRTDSRNREFADRGVPLLVSPGNPYFQQFLRKRSSGGQVCVKGRVERRRGASGDPVAVFFVETVGAAGDAHPKGKRGKK